MRAGRELDHPGKVSLGIFLVTQCQLNPSHCLQRIHVAWVGGERLTCFRQGFLFFIFRQVMQGQGQVSLRCGGVGFDRPVQQAQKGRFVFLRAGQIGQSQQGQQIVAVLGEDLFVPCFGGIGFAIAHIHLSQIHDGRHEVRLQFKRMLELLACFHFIAFVQVDDAAQVVGNRVVGQQSMKLRKCVQGKIKLFLL